MSDDNMTDILVSVVKDWLKIHKPRLARECRHKVEVRPEGLLIGSRRRENFIWDVTGQCLLPWTDSWYDWKRALKDHMQSFMKPLEKHQ